MESSADSYCRRAVAYLKVESPADEGLQFVLSRRNSPVLRALGHGLLVAYVVDEGESFSYVQHRHIDEAGLSVEDLHTLAITNLGAMAEQSAEVRQHGNMYAVLMGGNFEASLILFNEFWSEWYAGLAPSGFVAAFPARDLLAFGDASSAATHSELTALCERARGNVDHPLSSKIFRRVDEGWEPIDG